MATTKKSTGTKKNQQQQASGYVKAEFAIGAAIVCFVLGFFVSRFTDGGGSGQARFGENIIPVQQVGPIPTQSDAANMDFIAELEKQAKDNSKSAVAWTRLGNAYFDTDRYREAIEAYSKSLEQNPNDPDVLTDVGVMYRRIDAPEEAVRNFERAMQIDPTHEMSRFNKGIVLFYDLREKQGAIDAWEELAKINPQFRAPDGRLLTELIRTLK